LFKEQYKDDLKEVEKEGDQAECLNELQEPDDDNIDGILFSVILQLS
jgi:hypothetical protein